MFGFIWRTTQLSEFDGALTRERLIQGARLLLIDDECPLLLGELQQSGFSVDHDETGNDLRNIDNQIYDVIILDYHGVGQRLGLLHGMELLKYIKRVTPRSRIIAYTSRSLTASESEFFRLSHAVLPKDYGLGESLNIIEDEIRKSLSKEHLFEALLKKLEILDPNEKKRIHKGLLKSLSKKDENHFKNVIVKVCGNVAEKSADIIIKQLFWT